MFVLDGRQLVPGRPFEHGGVKYPSNWLKLSTPEDKQALGIEERPDPARVDSRFYWDHNLPKRLEDELATYENGDPVLDANGVQLVNPGLKTTWVSKQKETAGTLLAPSDWYITRKVDTGIEVPASTQQYRDGIRLTCGLREDQINQCTSTEQLAALVTNSSTIYDEATKATIANPEPYLTPWPKQPSA